MGNPGEAPQVHAYATLRGVFAVPAAMGSPGGVAATFLVTWALKSSSKRWAQAARVSMVRDCIAGTGGCKSELCCGTSTCFAGGVVAGGILSWYPDHPPSPSLITYHLSLVMSRHCLLIPSTHTHTHPRCVPCPDLHLRVPLPPHPPTPHTLSALGGAQKCRRRRSTRPTRPV